MNEPMLCYHCKQTIDSNGILLCDTCLAFGWRIDEDTMKPVLTRPCGCIVDQCDCEC